MDSRSDPPPPAADASRKRSRFGIPDVDAIDARRQRARTELSAWKGSLSASLHASRVGNNDTPPRRLGLSAALEAEGVRVSVLTGVAGPGARTGNAGMASGSGSGSGTGQGADVASGAGGPLTVAADGGGAAETAGASEVSAQAVPMQQARKVNKILVNARQKGNPVLKHVKAVSWEYADIIPDFQVGVTSCVLFLSLRYHRLHPEYIYERMKGVQHQYLLRILLVVVDIEDHQQSLRELTKGCILGGFTLFLSWSNADAGRYIEIFKLNEHRSADLIKERVDQDTLSRLTDCLTQIKSVNRTDVVTLVSTFGSLRNIMNATPEELSLCPGFGDQKVRRVIEAFNTLFLQTKSAGPSQSKKPGTQSVTSAVIEIADDDAANYEAEWRKAETEAQAAGPSTTKPATQQQQQQQQQNPIVVVIPDDDPPPATAGKGKSVRFEEQAAEEIAEDEGVGGTHVGFGCSQAPHLEEDNFDYVAGGDGDEGDGLDAGGGGGRGGGGRGGVVGDVGFLDLDGDDWG
ncbi:ssDNA endonuclease and repair protein rad10 [Phlyctochytrium bullatum]|nr:ssDNA endonuclease and repair protein rad10 [Phlyctochytrium bullatum]